MRKLWNLHRYATDSGKIKLHSRTNCALESYNRKINHRFTQRHPGLITFVAGLDEETDNLVMRLRDVASGKDVPPLYDDIPFPEIPEDYAEWIAPTVYVSLKGELLRVAPAAAAPVVEPTTAAAAPAVEPAAAPAVEPAMRAPAVAAPAPDVEPADAAPAVVPAVRKSTRSRRARVWDV